MKMENEMKNMKMHMIWNIVTKSVIHPMGFSISTDYLNQPLNQGLDK